MEIDPQKLKQLKALNEQERLAKSSLEMLLDRFRQKEEHVLAISAQMGTSISFITSVSMRWLASKVHFAKNLPMWEKEGAVIDENVLAELHQRAPDWRKQIPMMHYLAEREDHKFPSLLIAAWQKWTKNPADDNWLSGRARKHSVNATSIDSTGRYIDLDNSETSFFALDGQHRLMAIKGMVELVDIEKIPVKNEIGEPKEKGGVTIDDLGIDRTGLQSLLEERIGVEIIPSVMEGETSLEAKRRLRNIFVAINQTAKKLTKGELALLDENNGFAIVARKVMTMHPLLKGGRVDRKKNEIGEETAQYTTLQTIVDIARNYLGQKSEYEKWVAKGKDNLALRPEEEEIDQATEMMLNYFNNLLTMDSHNDLVQDRKKLSSFYRKQGPNENIFFRPIAQRALAEALGFLENDHDLKKILKTLANHEKRGDLKLRDKSSIWYGVLCDTTDEKMNRHTRDQTLCAKLLIHLLGSGTPQEDREALLTSFRQAREYGERWLNLEGKTVRTAEEVDLPRPWS